MQDSLDHQGRPESDGRKITRASDSHYVCRAGPAIAFHKWSHGPSDANNVSELYSRIFPKLAQHDKLSVFAWEDEDVNKLLSVLPKMPGLKTVRINNHLGKAKLSRAVKEKLSVALTERGGMLTYTHGTG